MADGAWLPGNGRQVVRYLQDRLIPPMTALVLGIAAHIAYQVLHCSLLVSLGWPAEETVEEIVSTQLAEVGMLHPLPSRKYPDHRRFGIVLEALAGHTTQPGEGTDVPFQECFQLLGWRGPGKGHGTGPHPRTEEMRHLPAAR